jgi:uncharacterized protein YggE
MKRGGETFIHANSADEASAPQGPRAPLGIKSFLVLFFKKELFWTLFLALLPCPAHAQTLLHLSATGQVVVLPDQMVADFTVQETAPGAPAAQAAVNRLMAKALAAARAVPGVVATTSGYNVFQPDSDKPEYQASQTLDLTIPAQGGTPPPAFTDLAGRLQQDGLLLNTLDGQLSTQGADAANAAAVTDAIHRLRAEAAAIAATLGDKPGPIQVLTVDSGNPAPVMPGRMMMALQAQAPPPQAAPGPVTVQANIAAVVALTPLAP